MGCPETSVNNYQSTLRNDIPKERRSQYNTCLAGQKIALLLQKANVLLVPTTQPATFFHPEPDETTSRDYIVFTSTPTLSKNVCISRFVTKIGRPQCPFWTPCVSNKFLTLFRMFVRISLVTTLLSYSGFSA
jgi:hypothetical protein